MNSSPVLNPLGRDSSGVSSNQKQAEEKTDKKDNRATEVGKVEVDVKDNPRPYRSNNPPQTDRAVA